MKLRMILLTLMIFYDFSLHFVELFSMVDKHPLYITFPFLNLISYGIFWTFYYGIATLLAITLLGSGVTVKHKTIIQNFPTPKEKETKNPIEEIKDKRNER